MSSLPSIFPLGKTLPYWAKKLKGDPDRLRFLFTKVLEIWAFQPYSGKVPDLPASLPLPTGIPNEAPNRPVISLVIPTYLANPADLANFQALIGSVMEQILPPRHLIIIDDHSPMTFDCPKEAIVKRLERNQGPAGARNAGIAIALELGSDVVAFTDVDCQLDKNWGQALVSTFRKHRQYSLLSGRTLSLDRGWPGRYHDLNGTLNGRKFRDSNCLLYGTTANLAVMAQVFEKIRFNENFPFAAGEDIEFCLRANQQGFQIGFAPEMVVRHHFGYTGNAWQNYRKLMRQFKRYGVGERQLRSEAPEFYAYFDQTIEIANHFLEHGGR